MRKIFFLDLLKKKIFFVIKIESQINNNIRDTKILLISGPKQANTQILYLKLKNYFFATKLLYIKDQIT